MKIILFFSVFLVFACNKSKKSEFRTSTISAETQEQAKLEDNQESEEENEETLTEIIRPVEVSGAFLSGTTYDEQGSVLAGAEVYVRGDPNVRVKTNSMGEFEIEVSEQAKKYQDGKVSLVSRFQDGEVSLAVISDPIDYKNSEDSPGSGLSLSFNSIPLVLKPTGAAKVTVDQVNTANQDLSVVEILIPGTDFRVKYVDGNFNLEGLPPGNWELVVIKEDSEPQKLESKIDIEPNKLNQIAVQIETFTPKQIMDKQAEENENETNSNNETEENETEDNESSIGNEESDDQLEDITLSLNSTPTQNENCNFSWTGTSTFNNGLSYASDSASATLNGIAALSTSSSDSGVEATFDPLALVHNTNFTLTWSLDGNPGSVNANTTSSTLTVVQSPYFPNVSDSLPNRKFSESNLTLCKRGHYGSVVLGSDFGCSIKKDKTVQCWGNGWAGAKGNSSFNGTPSATPVTVSVLDGSTPALTVRRLSTGSHQTVCAATETGAAYCWGRNDFYQIGDGTNDNKNVPTPVSGLDGSDAASSVRTIGTGYSFACALTEDGAVKCWGERHLGKIGDGGSTSGQQSTPIGVDGIDGLTDEKTAVDLFVGQDYSCAIMKTGPVKCWGRNHKGQLGNGNNTEQNSPQLVSGLDASSADLTVLTMALGDGQTCALMGSGRVKCWGDDASFGGLGCNDCGDSNVPVLVDTSEIDGSTDAKTAVAIGSRNDSVFALMKDGRIKAWGRNENGRLGVGDTANKSVPTYVDETKINGNSDTSTAVLLSIGVSGACAVMADESLNCWGYNNAANLALGIAASGDYTTPSLAVPADNAFVTSFEIQSQ